jgi:hypothetical protein
LGTLKQASCSSCKRTKTPCCLGLLFIQSKLNKKDQETGDLFSINSGIQWIQACCLVGGLLKKWPGPQRPTLGHLSSITTAQSHGQLYYGFPRLPTLMTCSHWCRGDSMNGSLGGKGNVEVALEYQGNLPTTFFRGI